MNDTKDRCNLSCPAYKENNTVSIIMPMHNSEKFVCEAIESVLAQTYADWELLVVDDGSTDNSINVVRNFADKDKRIRLLHSDRHIGMPSAPRNVGVSNARGRYVAFLDSDDRWLPHKLERQVALFDNDDVLIVFSNYEKIDEHGTRRHRVITAPATATYKSLLRGNVIGNLTGIYDRAKTDKVAIEDIHHEDYVMWLSILKRGGIAQNTNTVEAEYRVMSNSVSSDKTKVMRWQWAIYRTHERLSVFRSCFYFVHYAVRALYKALK